MVTFDDVVAKAAVSGEIPALGPTVSEVLRLTGDQGADFRAVSRAVERDPALAARVLKVANSPYFGLRGEVASVDRAVALLGLGEVRNIAVSVSVIGGFSARFGGETFDWTRFWEHSAGCALIARCLGRLLRLPTGGEEYVAGLLHDVGKILLGHHFPEEFRRVLALAAQGGLTMEEAEVRVCGTDHGRLGLWLAERWGLPAALAAAVGWHHHPERAGDHELLASIVHLADLFAKAKAIGFGGDGLAVCFADAPAWAVLRRIRPEFAELDVERFTFELDREVDAARDLLRAARSS